MIGRKSPLRILHVVESLDRGGLERMVIDLANEQARAGHAVSIATLYRPGELASELDGSRVRLIDCAKDRHGAWGAWRHLRRMVAGGFDVLHGHNPMAHYYAVFASLGRSRMTRIVTRHGMGSATLGGGRGRWLFRRSLAFTDCSVAVCEAASDVFQRADGRLGSTWESIPNGIDLAKVVPVSNDARKDLLASLGVVSSDCIVGCVGRLTEVKQHQVLLQAFARLLVRVPSAQLVVVGDGPLRASLEEAVRSAGIAASVHFTGARQDVNHLLAGFDIFALTSRSEGYSLALVEAAAAGLPIVASDVGGNGEIVNNGSSGLLFEAGDEKACARHLEVLALCSEQRHELGAKGRAWALAHASTKAMADAYEGIYRTGDGRCVGMANGVATTVSGGGQ